ncbi:MAG: virulence RhuM family protein [Burkholderiales bacterium]|jgi:prophage maintenance system killer protein|nr:virulence RhuM family protein [Burkholderiales bacterium]
MNDFIHTASPDALAPQQSFAIYETQDKSVWVEVKTDGDTVWLNRQQMATLFGRDVKTIGKHVKNALDEELRGLVVVANFATTAPHGAIPGKTQTRLTEHYNLDMILSVGFRVKSSEGIHFRRWANAVLKKHLISGFTLNRQRLAQLNKVVELIGRSEIAEVSGISAVLERFTAGLTLLDDYDHQSLSKPKGFGASYELGYEEARAFVDSMNFSEASPLFGREKDESFKSALGAIYQTFGGEELYPTVYEKSANLLYFLIKNHAFVDGNKRIAAALFVYFLGKNNALLDKNGKPIISNNALAAITLMIALSKPEEKETMCLLVMNMLNFE